MDARTYRVNSMREAVELIRSELGPEASVLHTRRLKRNWLTWLRGGARLEVIASRDAPVPRRVIVDPSRSPSRSIWPQAYGNDNWSELRMHLQESGWWDEDIEKLNRRWNDEEAISSQPLTADAAAARCLHLVADALPVADPFQPATGRPRVIAIVGPTGVGKTTSLAKLADHLRQMHQARVGLVTVDTRRIAAAEQLRLFAGMLSVPMEVSRTPSELAAAVARLSHLDFILIDTFGPSTNDRGQLDHLHTVLRGSPIDETMLVMNCQSTTSVFRQAVANFTLLGVKSLLLSKLDECDAIGHMWGALADSPWPVRYMSGGQELGEGFQSATREDLAKRMFPMSIRPRCGYSVRMERTADRVATESRLGDANYV